MSKSTAQRIRDGIRLMNALRNSIERDEARGVAPDADTLRLLTETGKEVRELQRQREREFAQQARRF